jgi:hypothetical protein
MACTLGSTINSSVTVDEDFWHILIDVSDGTCSTGLVTLTDVQRDPYNGLKQTQTLSVGKAILQQCPDVDEPTLFVVFAQVEATAIEVPSNETVMTTTAWYLADSAVNTTVLICTPSYKIQRALVTTNPQGVLGRIETRPDLRNLTISRWDLWSAVNSSLVASGPSMLEGPVAHDVRAGGNLYDDLFGVMISTWTRSPIEYLNPETLSDDTQRLFKVVANQIAARYLSRDSTSTTTGIYRATQSRVVLLGGSLRVVEAGIAIIVICACLMIAYSPWVPYSRAGDNLTTLAVILAQSNHLKASLKGSGHESYERIEQSLTGRTFACIEYDSVEGDLLQMYDLSDGPEFNTTTADRCFWSPSALSKIMKAITLVIPLALIASLEVT